MSSIIMLGRLAKTEELDMVFDRYRNPVYSNGSGYSSLIKPISEQPEAWDTDIFYNCSISFLDSDLDKTSEFEIKKFLSDKLIVFRAGKQKNIDYGFRYTAFDPEYAEAMDVDKIIDSSFVSVPIFNLDTLKLTFEEFEAKLLRRERIRCVPFISRDNKDNPTLFMACKKEDSGSGLIAYVYGNYEKLDVRDYGSTIIGGKLGRARFDIASDGQFLVECNPKYSVIFMTIETEIKYNQMLVEIPVSADFLNRSPITNENASNTTAFINAVKNVMAKNELVYDVKDFIKFDIAAKTSNLIILAGMSGTGKSKLVRVYSEALGIDKYNGLKFIPVSPSWTDDSDVLGYVDYHNNLYREADCGLVSFLNEAANHPDQKYIVCLDEMNLSKIEHYFSQFISILENESGSKVLNIYNKDMESKLYNAEKYPCQIEIKDNIIFVGTVNIDESTSILSDKVLDRANVMKLKMQPFANLKNVVENFVITDEELSFLTKLNNILISENPKMGIGYRIITQMNTYLQLLPEKEYYSRGEALDSLVAQRIITKIRGAEEQIGSIVGRINLDNELECSLLVDLFNEFSSVSDFSVSKHDITVKARELKSYGYTI